jgi:bis(5'-nucleosyl)-tetraphosphatase (symmetrical)
MADYAIGDLQGDYAALQSLLVKLDFQPERDRAWFAGDLINRGPDSLACVRRVRDLGESVRTVLGNHDLHFLCVEAGVAPARKGDTFDELLAAADRAELVAWLRAQPLVVHEGNHLMVHAGLLPQWTPEDAVRLSGEVMKHLAAADYADFLVHLYGDQPDVWSESLAGTDRLRLIVNAMTRMRVCHGDGRLELRFKGEPGDAPAGTKPWFDLPGRRSGATTVICGHWSAVGLKLRDDLIALDTGAQWGRALTAVRLHDRTVFQVPGTRAGIATA